MGFKNIYIQYSLIIIILVLGVAIFLELTSFMTGILGAMTIYILLRKQMMFLTEKKKLKKGLVAVLLLIETIMVFLIPVSVIVVFVVENISHINLNPHELIGPIEDLAGLIKEQTGYSPLKEENLSTILGLLPKIVRYMMNGISSLLVNFFVLIVVLYFMLISREKMEQYIYDLLPFSEENKKGVLREINRMVTSNALGIPLLGIIQGGIALVGYYIFDVPNALMFGLMTSLVSVIPIVGTGLVWVPLAAYIAIKGNWPDAIGLTCYGALIITQVDNLVRFLLQKKLADIHPLITIFGVIVGLSLFGFMGIIFGPLLLSIFLLCFNIFKKEYLK